MVRKGGLEPPCLSAPPPQDGVSANSTTSAKTRLYLTQTRGTGVSPVLSEPREERFRQFRIHPSQAGERLPEVTRPRGLRSVRRVVLRLLRPRVEYIETAIGIGGELKIISSIWALRIRNELLRHIVPGPAFLGKMQLPQVFQMR